MNNLIRTVVSIALLAITWSAYADDRNPAPYRGAPNSLLAIWDVLYPPPDIVYGEGFEPSLFDDSNAVFPVFNTMSPCGGGLLGGVGGPCLFDPFAPNGTSGEIWITMPNVVDPLPEKHLRLQLTWTRFGVGGSPPPPTAPPAPYSAEAFDPAFVGPFGPSSVAFSAVEMGDPDGITGDVLAYMYIDYIWYPNPDWELFKIFLLPFEGHLTQVVIDSVSVPVPPALPLLGSALAFLGWRKRKKSLTKKA